MRNWKEILKESRLPKNISRVLHALAEQIGDIGDVEFPTPIQTHLPGIVLNMMKIPNSRHNEWRLWTSGNITETVTGWDGVLVNSTDLPLLLNYQGPPIEGIIGKVTNADYSTIIPWIIDSNAVILDGDMIGVVTLDFEMGDSVVFSFAPFYEI